MSVMTARGSVLPQEVAPATVTKGRWGSVVAMALAFVSDNLEGGLINTLFPVIRAALGLDLGALGLLSSISRFARMIFGPLWAILADRYGHKRVLVILSPGSGACGRLLPVWPRTSPNC